MVSRDWVKSGKVSEEIEYSGIMMANYHHRKGFFILNEFKHGTMLTKKIKKALVEAPCGVMNWTVCYNF